MYFTLHQTGRDWYNEHKDSVTHIISIVCPDDKVIEPIHDNHVVVRFWDIDKKLENKFRKYDVVDAMTAMDPVLIALKWYLHACQDDSRMDLLVHCDAGISRSAAVSVGILWHLSHLLFREDPGAEDILLTPWIEARKRWCMDQVSEDCVGLRRFIEGRFKPGVMPNQAVLRHYRETLPYFPW